MEIKQLRWKRGTCEGSVSYLIYQGTCIFTATTKYPSSINGAEYFIEAIRQKETSFRPQSLTFYDLQTSRGYSSKDPGEFCLDQLTVFWEPTLRVSAWNPVMCPQWLQEAFKEHIEYSPEVFASEEACQYKAPESRKPFRILERYLHTRRTTRLLERQLPGWELWTISTWKRSGSQQLSFIRISPNRKEWFIAKIEQKSPTSPAIMLGTRAPRGAPEDREVDIQEVVYPYELEELKRMFLALPGSMPKTKFQKASL